MVRRNKQQKLLYYTRPHFYNKLLAQLDEIEEKVCWLLAKHEHFRNCDKCLIFHYWKEVDEWNRLTLRQDIHALTSPESIIRIRRHLQNDLDLWIPTDQEVIKARKIKEEGIKSWLSMHKRMAFNEYDTYSHTP